MEHHYTLLQGASTTDKPPALPKSISAVLRPLRERLQPHLITEEGKVLGIMTVQRNILGKKHIYGVNPSKGNRQFLLGLLWKESHHHHRDFHCSKRNNSQLSPLVLDFWYSHLPAEDWSSPLPHSTAARGRVEFSVIFQVLFLSGERTLEHFLAISKGGWGLLWKGSNEQSNSVK